MKHAYLARRYARALMSVAEEHNTVDETADDLLLIGRALSISRDLKVLLASPVVREPKKIAVMREVFARRVGRLTQSFIDLLLRKHREVHLQEVIEQYHTLRDEMRGVITVDVTSAIDLQSKQEKALSAELARRTGKVVKLRLARDPDIMGGLVIKIGDTVLDASVRHQLAKLRDRFIGTARFISN